MKKFLLTAALALVAFASAFAVTDGQTYEPVNGIKIVNSWILDRFHTPTVFPKAEYCNTRARTAVMNNGVIYIARSEVKAAVVAPGDTVAQSVIYRLDAKTGAELPALDVTLDGKPYGGLLAVNSIGRDNFGHVWVMPYSEKKAEVPVYTLNVETGELTLVTTLSKGDKIARTDYYDVIGDITREKAECNIMAAAALAATIYRWHADQGAEEFEGGFEGDISLEITSFFPETVTLWGYAPVVKMCYDPASETPYAGELFYIDGFNSVPALYDVTGSLIDSFEAVDKALYPEAGTNGVAEFTLDGRNFMVYSIAQYSGTGHGCQANIVELGEGMSLGGMTKYWQIPADSLGQTSDGGTRVHSFNVEYNDAQDVVTLFDFKCYNGMAVYQIGKNVGGGEEPGTKGDINADGVVNVSDVTALINKILGTATYADATCDINADGVVNVSDVTALINIILAGN
ncbi:MAG: dockerin type I repeat-containing protein [Sodaliphilus sp.]|nr:dockerin type I repeat-containing protein [Sodaliphilus sp.]